MAQVEGELVFFGFQVNIGLEHPVKKNKTINPCIIHVLDYHQRICIKRAQFDTDRDLHTFLHIADHVELLIHDGFSFPLEIGGDGVEIKFKSINTGIFQAYSTQVSSNVQFKLAITGICTEFTTFFR